MSNLKITLENGEARVSGFIDETTDLSDLKNLKGPLILNLKEVTRINSLGVREWISTVATLPAPSIRYKECSPVVVKQINHVPDFLGSAKVESFYAPYFCEDCDQEALTLLQSHEVKGIPPEVKCPSCKNSMKFDAIPSQYFGFLSRA